MIGCGASERPRQQFPTQDILVKAVGLQGYNVTLEILISQIEKKSSAWDNLNKPSSSSADKNVVGQEESLLFWHVKQK